MDLFNRPQLELNAQAALASILVTHPEVPKSPVWEAVAGMMFCLGADYALGRVVKAIDIMKES